MLKCHKCGAQYPDDYDDMFGRTQETSGLGPDVVCVQLVEDKRAPKASDGSIPRQVCRGRIIAALATEVADVKKAAKLSPITAKG